MLPIFRSCCFALISLAAFSVALPATDSRFIVPPTYTVGTEAAGVASGDFNGDGKPDLVTTNQGSFNISVLINNGDGTFQPPVTYSTGEDNSILSVAVADVNNDGKLDIVAGGAWCCSGQLVVFLGKGDGTFQAGVPYPLGGWGASSIAIADMNGDGKLDLIVPGTSLTGTGDSVISVLLGNGDGTFQAAITSTLTYSAGSYDTLVAGDFNKDSKTDIALVASGQLLLLLGNGNGTFPNPTLPSQPPT